MRNNRNQDKDLKLLLKGDIPEAPRNEWFTRKVLNRLPPRRPEVSIIEKWVFLIVFIGVTVWVTLLANHILTSPVLYVRDFVMMGLSVFVFIALSAWILIPLSHDL